MPKQPASSKSVFRNFLLFVFVFVVFAAALSFYNSPVDKPENIGVNEVAEYIKTDRVDHIVVREGAEIEVTLKPTEGQTAGTVVQASKEASESLPTVLSTYGVTAEQLQQTSITVEGASGWKYFLFNILPIILPIIFIVFFLWVMLRQVQGGNNRAMMFGQSTARQVDPDRKKKTTFKDVAGAKEAKEELSEIVEFLKHPKKFSALGAKIPKGVLLMGPPGTGKTLMARAVAGEAGVPFFHISGSEFVEMFVGVGASRVRDIFKKAKKASPAILFVDEIDAVGRQRGTGLGGSHDEREQTLNQILTEMDGFEEDTNVIVVAATNRADVLDPALLRPGRFDRRVVIGLPDISERQEILAVHARNKVLSKNVDLHLLAQRTIGFSGADLMNLLNEAAILAARSDKTSVSLQDCLESIDKVLLGPQRKSAQTSKRETEITAYHEAGHALVAYLLPDADPVHKVSIIPRGRAGGFTLKLPEEDRKLQSKKALLADIAVSLGGHAAEIFKFEDVTTGPSSDLEKATQVARSIVAHYGMTDALGPRTFGETQDMVFLGKEIHEQRNYSEATAQNIDAEIDRIIRQQYAIVNDLIKTNQDKLDRIAKHLLVVETVERADFEALLAGKLAVGEALEVVAEPADTTPAPAKADPHTDTDDSEDEEE